MFTLCPSSGGYIQIIMGLGREREDSVVLDMM